MPVQASSPLPRWLVALCHVLDMVGLMLLGLALQKLLPVAVSWIS